MRNNLQQRGLGPTVSHASFVRLVCSSQHDLMGFLDFKASVIKLAVYISLVHDYIRSIAITRRMTRTKQLTSILFDTER